MYHNSKDDESLSEILKHLEKLYNQQLSSSDQLDAKAWDIAKIATTVLVGWLGLSLSLDLFLAEQSTIQILTIISGMLSFLAYAGCVHYVLQIIKPRDYWIPPGFENTKDLLEKYVHGEVSVIQKLIVDYAGNENKPGAICNAKHHNNDKVTSLMKSIIALALFMLFAAITLFIGSIIA